MELPTPGSDVGSVPASDEVVSVRVPAKINLYLSVGARRADGYHELVTVYEAISLYDLVTVRADVALSVTTVGEAAHEVPADADNLAGRAVLALARATNRAPAVSVSISKRIPVAGGLAGGSADAAAALLACARLWRLDLSVEQLAELGAGVGSDVPFPLTGGTALGTGRGERVSPVLSRGRRHWVVATANRGLSTPEAYAELDRLRDAQPAGRGQVSGSTRTGDIDDPGPAAVLRGLASGDLGILATALSNDLQAAAVSLRPDLVPLLAAGDALGALASLVSGSGPTCLFLAADEPAALRIADGLARTPTYVSARVVHGPVPGARVV